MFEGSVFSSGDRALPVRSSWTAAASIGVQALLLGAAVLPPLLRTEVLPLIDAAPGVVVFHAPAPPPPVRRMEVSEASSPMSTPSPVRIETVHGNLSRLLQSPGEVAGEGPVMLAAGAGISPMGGGGLPGALTGGGSPGPEVRMAVAGKTRISAGVSAGMLLGAIRPVYPAIAKAAGVQGTVVVTATIDRTGRIVGAQVTSGPMLLREAALEAIRGAHYRPFLLNGEPTEVETTISVNFRMGA